MFVNVYVVYVWDVCNEIYFHLYKEIFIIPLIFKLIDTTPVIFMISRVICIIGRISRVGGNWSYLVAFPLDF